MGRRGRRPSRGPAGGPSSASLPEIPGPAGAATAPHGAASPASPASSQEQQAGKKRPRVVSSLCPNLLHPPTINPTPLNAVYLKKKKKDKHCYSCSCLTGGGGEEDEQEIHMHITRPGTWTQDAAVCHALSHWARVRAHAEPSGRPAVPSRPEPCHTFLSFDRAGAQAPLLSPS